MKGQTENFESELDQLKIKVAALEQRLEPVELSIFILHRYAPLEAHRELIRVLGQAPPSPVAPLTSV